MKQLTLLCVSIFATTLLFAQGNNNGFIRDFAKKWENAKVYTIKFAEAMPEADYNYKPVPAEMTFGEQLVHIAQNMTGLSSAYLAGKKNPFLKLSAEGKSKQEIIDLLNKSFDYVDSLIISFNSSHLDDTVHFFAGTMTKRRIFFLLADHVAHHRGQLVVYLRLNGIKPPEYVGW